MVELYIYCSMNKQYVEAGTKWKKAHLISVSNITMWFFCFLAMSETTSLPFKKQAIRGREGVSETVISILLGR